MQIQAHPLEQFFQQQVSHIFEGRLGLNDPEISTYIARVLCNFSDVGSPFAGNRADGHTLDELLNMMRAADPVFGTAPSFDAERAMRKYIGDYALFVAGMLPEALGVESSATDRRPSLGELIRAGRASYHIVGEFNLFEYKREAGMFSRLSHQFERYVLALSMVREELGKCLAGTTPPA